MPPRTKAAGGLVLPPHADPPATLNPFQAIPQVARAWVYFINVVLGLAIVYLSARGVWGIGAAELTVYAGLQPFVSLTSLSNVHVGP